MKILAHPAGSKDNNFLSVFYASIEKEGGEIIAYSKRKLVFGEYDVVHIHWPEFLFCRQKRVDTLFFLFVNCVSLWIAKCLRGKKIVWLCHEPYPHDRSPKKYLMVVVPFVYLITHVYFLSKIGMEKAYEYLPILKKKPYLLFKHPAYPIKKYEDLVCGDTDLLAFGLVRKYKNYEELIKMILHVNQKAEHSLNFRLVGYCSDDELKKSLSKLAEKSDSVEVELEFISEERLTSLIESCRAVIFNYREITNSGAAIRALSQGRPIVGPRIGALIELEEEFGSDKVYLFDSLDESEILKAAEWIKSATRNFPMPKEYSPNYIAKQICGDL